jgi:hypothetical protein
MLLANPSHKGRGRLDIISDHAQMLLGGYWQPEQRSNRLWQRVEVLGSLNGLIPEKFDQAVGLYMLANMYDGASADSSLTAACAKAALRRKAFVTSSTGTFLSRSKASKSLMP